MTKFAINEKEALLDLKGIMQSWKPNGNSEELMDELFNKLIQANWDRTRIYDFVFIYLKDHLSDSDYQNIPEAAFDYLSDIESSIIGHCSYDSILKISGEPKDEDELIAYVRGKKWKQR